MGNLMDPIAAKAGPWPGFCNTCWKRDECNQKENMLAETEAVKGFLAGNEENGYYYVCEDCLTNKDHDPFPLSNEEADSPRHCEECGAALIHPLTSEGAEYVKEAIAEGGGCCRELWPVVWADYLDEKKG